MTFFSFTHTRLYLGLIFVLACMPSIAQRLSPAEAADSARNATGGKVLKVKAIKKERVHYRVKVLLPKGQVRHIMVDGDSGDVHLHHKKPPKYRPLK